MKINKINKILKLAALPALAATPIIGISTNIQKNNITKAEANVVSYDFENWTINGDNTTMSSVVEVEKQELTLTFDISIDQNKAITVTGLQQIKQSITTDKLIDLNISFKDVQDSDNQKYFISTFGGGTNSIFKNSDLDTYTWLDGVSIDCPKYLQSINTNAFKFDNIEKSIKFIGITFNSALVYIMDNAFQNCSYLTGDIVIPGGTRTIGANAFEAVGSKADNKPKLLISEGVWFIGASAFLNADFANDFNVPSTIIHIGKNAFGVSEATKAKNITFNMTSFSQYNYTTSESTDYFYGLSSLDGVTTKISVPSSVRKNIEDAAKNTANSIWKKYIDAGMVKNLSNTNSVVGGIIVGVSIAILLVAFGIAIYRNRKNRPQSPKVEKAEKAEVKTEKKAKTKTTPKTTKKAKK